MKVLHQGHHGVLGVTNYRAITQEIIAINCERVFNQACRRLHYIHAVIHSFITTGDLGADMHC